MPRDSNGLYTLPAGNPVVSDTTISSSWANTTLADIAAEIQDSLDRSGKGGMLVSFNFSNGTVGNPGITFTNDTTTGLRLNAANDMRAVASGTDVAKFTSSLLEVLIALKVDGLLSAAANIALTNTGVNSITSSSTGSNTAFYLNASAAPTNLLTLALASVSKFAVDASGNVTANSMTTANTAKAWVYCTWNGASWTVNSSYNVTSVNQIGVYTQISLTNLLADANYSIALGMYSAEGGANSWHVEDYQPSKTSSLASIQWWKGTTPTAPNTNATLSVAIYR